MLDWDDIDKGSSFSLGCVHETENVFGFITLNITFSPMTFSPMTFSLMTYSTFSKTTLNIMNST